MRVLIVHNILWSHYKAALFSALAAEAADGEELLVLQLAESEKKYSELGKAGEIDHRYPYKLLTAGSLDSVTIPQKIRFILSEIRRFKPDIVNLTGYYDPAYWPVIVWCRLSGIRLVLSNESGENDGSRKGIKEQFKKALVRAFDGYICFGTSSARYLLRLGAREDRILSRHAAVINEAVIRNVYQHALPDRATQKARLGLPGGVIAFVGRLAPEKNLPKLITAFRRVATGGWKLLVIGDGPLRNDVEAQSDICWLGGRPWNEVPEALALADALVLPSSFEPWGLVVNEAMTCGLPVLVSRRCGCTDDLLRPGENGYLFDPEDDASLETALKTFMALPDVARADMGARSLQLISPFSTEKVAAELWQGFRLLTKRAR